MHVTKLKGQMRAKQTCRSTVNMDHKLRVVSQDVRPETFKTVPNNERIRLLCETLGALFGNPSHALQLCSWPSQPLRLHPVQRCIETCEQVKTDCTSCGIQQLPLPVSLLCSASFTFKRDQSAPTAAWLRLKRASLAHASIDA
jgi:hypothetical protein